VLKTPILITGAARSGISLIGGVVHLCGAWGGLTTQISHFDGRGSFENMDIRNSVIRPFLRGIGASPSGQFPLPDIQRCRQLQSEKNFITTWRRRVEGIFQRQGYEEGPLFLASPLLCLMWPIWAKVFPDAQWILVRRKDEDIVRSCMKTGFMGAHKGEEEWSRWVQNHKVRFREMVRADLDLWQIWPRRMIRGKFKELRELVERLELRWDKTAVEDFVAPILWKGGVFQVDES